MNQNDLDLAMTNMAIALPSYKEATKFHNAEIIILGEYTIDEIAYVNGELHFSLKERDDVQTDV